MYDRSVKSSSGWRTNIGPDEFDSLNPFFKLWTSEWMPSENRAIGNWKDFVRISLVEIKGNLHNVN